MIPPKVFISYSHDTADHKQWVLEFATTLRVRGVDVTLDQWDLRPGDDIPHFMETQLEAANYVLMICTENYVQKANSGMGGVGYEKMIVTASMLSRIDDNKVIPIIRQNGSANLPSFLKTKLYIDFSKTGDIEYNLDDLLRTILNAPLFEKPEIGSSSFTPMEENRPDRTSDGIKQIMTDIAKAYEGTHTEHLAYARLVKITSLSRLSLDFYVKKAIKKELVEKSTRWKDSILITEAGLHYLVEKKIIET